MRRQGGRSRDRKRANKGLVAKWGRCHKLSQEGDRNARAMNLDRVLGVLLGTLRLRRSLNSDHLMIGTYRVKSSVALYIQDGLVEK